MNIAIVGSNGYIAGYLRRSLLDQGHMVLKIDQTGDDTEHINLQRAEIFNYSILDSIDFVVFAAAISAPDKCAEEYDLCWRINVDGTCRFIREATSRNCRVLFFSSDAVYGDIQGYIYTEVSRLEGATPYGEMKRAVEREFKRNPYFKAVRLSYVMSSNDKFTSYCLGCIRNNRTADIFHPFYRNVVSVTDVIKVVSWFIHRYDEFPHKAINVAGGELVSRVRIADELNRITGNRLKYIISVPAPGFFNNRPAITQMRSLYAQEYGILENEPFTQKIQREMEGIKI